MGMGSQQARKQAEQHKSLQRWELKKEQAQTFSPRVKQVSGSFNKASAAVLKLLAFACLFCPIVLSLAAYVGKAERKITWIACLLSYMTLNKLLNPQVSVKRSINWGPTTYLEVRVRINCYEPYKLTSTVPGGPLL